MRRWCLGMVTELGLAASVEDRGDHLVIRTPGQPGYYWGNWLAFPDAPGPGDAERWPALFRAAFGDDPAIRHMAFGWDDPAGAAGTAAEFAGFAFDYTVMLTATALAPPARPAAVTCRPLVSDADWAAATANQIACRGGAFELGAYTAFKRAQMAGYRRRVEERGQGAWWGAFDGDALVGDLGLFPVESLGRYQAVGTAPGHRRRGVAATLVHAAGRAALDGRMARTLVMAAEPGSDGDRVYRSLGFAPAEHFAGLLKAPADEKR